MLAGLGAAGNGLGRCGAAAAGVVSIAALGEVGLSQQEYSQLLD
jgi:hypothetical protein